MAKKTYKTFHLKGLQILIDDEDGRTIEVNFKSGCQIDSTAKFSTSDEKVQEAVESCSGFKRDYYLESVREDEPVAVPANAIEEEPADSEDSKSDGGFVSNSFAPIKVATKSDAIEWLKEHYPEKEYTAVKLRSKAAFDAACEECGVVFEIAE